MIIRRKYHTFMDWKAVSRSVFGFFLGTAFLWVSAGPGLADVKILEYNKDGKAGVIHGFKLKNKDHSDPKADRKADRKAAGKDSPFSSSFGTTGKGPSGSSRANGNASASASASAPFDPATVYEEGEVVVTDPPRSFEAAARRLGFGVLERVSLDALGMTVLRLSTPKGMSVADAVASLRKRFPGLPIDANHQFDPSAGASRPQSVAREAIGWGAATATCGKGIRIGMIDGGVDLSHPALMGQDIRFRSFHKKGHQPGPADHGTAVAAIMIGKATSDGWGGLLPGASLYAANMFEYNKKGRLVGNAIAFLKAINWMAQNKIRVVNLSVAGADNKALRAIFKRAQRKGLVMVAAAGNWGRNAKPAYPAAYREVVAVTAYGKDNLVYRRANQGNYIDFAAPGVRMWTATPGGGKYQSGTSFAVPYLSVLIALEISKGGIGQASSLRRVLKKGTMDMGLPGKDKVFGWGGIETRPAC